MPLSQTPGAIAARARRATAAVQRVTSELTFARRAVETARRTLEEAQRPRVYATPPSAAPSAVRARATRLAARIDLATYDLSQAEARLARATNPPAPVPAPRARRARRAVPPTQISLDAAIEEVLNIADTLVNSGRGRAQLQISVWRKTMNARGTWSQPFERITPKTAADLYARTENLRETIFYERAGEEIVRVTINRGASIIGRRTFQIFRDGAEHCVIGPIIELFERKLNDTTSDKRAAELRALIKKAVKGRDGKWKLGVPEDELQDLCNYLRVKILIKTPCTADSKTQVISPRGAPIASVVFVHTRMNHLDTNVTIDNKIHVSREKLQEIFEEIKHTEEYFEFMRYQDGVVWVRTIHGTYAVDQEFNDFVREKEREWGLSRIDAVKNPELSDFISSGMVHPGHCDTRPSLEFKRSTPCGDIISGRDDYVCLDMKAAFTQARTCDQYVGFPARITDYRKTTKEMGIGFYTVESIFLSPRVAEVDKLLGGIFTDGATLTSASLKFLRDHGCTYSITAGAWGTRTDIDFTDPCWFEKENGVPLYSSTVGRWMIQRDHETFCVHGSQEYLRHVAALNEDSEIIRVYPEWGELMVTRRRESAYHLRHDAAYITEYVILAMLKQVMAMDLPQIIRIGCDCVYTTQMNAPLTGAFRLKEGELIKTNMASNQYVNRRPWAPAVPSADFRDMAMIEVHTGPAGCGKTHSILTDPGLVNVLYVAPSYILAAEVRAKYGVRAVVWHNTLTDVPTYHEFEREYNTLVFDESFAMTRGMQEKIINRYSKSRIVFCGDHCQLGPWSEDNEPIVPFDKSLCDREVPHKQNYRCKCPVLAKVLGSMRAHIEDDMECFDLAIGSFRSVSRADMIKVYNPRTDLILTHSNLSKETYTKTMDDAGKEKRYRVKERIGEHFNGSIVFELTSPLTEAKAPLNHSSTVHSTQGITVKRQANGGRLFIDRSCVRHARLIYTAASRCEEHDQIFLIDDDEETPQPAPSESTYSCTEYASVEVARWILSQSDDELDVILKKHIDKQHKIDVYKHGDKVAEAERRKNIITKRTQTRRYASRVIMCNGKVTAHYRRSEENRFQKFDTGRQFCIGPCMQSQAGAIRGLYMRHAAKQYRDLDQVSAHPNLLLWVARKHGIDTPCLERYTRERDVLLEELGMDKQGVLSMMNKDKLTKHTNQYAVALDKEFKAIQAVVWSCPEYNYRRTRVVKQKPAYLDNPRGSYMNQLLTDLENMLLMRVAAKLTDVHSLYFDGLITADPVTVDQLNSWTADYGVKWSVKQHCTRIQMPSKPQ